MQPSLFISHGSPMIAIEDQPVRRFLRDLGPRLAPPAAIVVVSAHFDMADPTVTAGERPETIHDFGGFPRALYEIQYPAQGSPAVAARAVELLRDAGFAAVGSDRGLDHGAWIPLLLMFPDADIPVVELSVMTRRAPDYHYALGCALREIRREGVLVIGSGGATHNLHEYFRRGDGSDASPDWLDAFEDWLVDRLEAGAVDDLLDYRNAAPSARLAHPTEEHLLPLFVAMGAGDGDTGQRIHTSRDRVLTLDAWRF